MDDETRFKNLQEKEEQLWEAKCLRCGACCGVVEGDPCQELRKAEDGKYFCSVYETRFGLRKTINGRIFRCVPIREILHQSWLGDSCCGYKKFFK